MPDGTTGFVVERAVTADLEVSFNLITPETQTEAVRVDVDLDYNSSYTEWATHAVNGFEIPDFPVTDLGEIVDLYSSEDLSGSPQSIDIQPQDTSPQWAGGEILITASDGSSILITPDTDQSEALLIELNNSGVPVSRLWSDGYQIDCPGILEGCSGAEF